jgi:polysaccharide pyruvyl transferase WcaK-like protein
MEEVLPCVDWISCREDRFGPPLLLSLGIFSSRFSVTGDAALALARAACPPLLGDSIGVSLRAASYSGVGDACFEPVQKALAATSRRLGAGLRAIPISLRGPSDLEKIRALCPECRTLGDERYESPDEVIREAGRCRIVVTGTYHAAVFAVAQGIPFIGLTSSLHYRSKLGGLKALFPEADSLLDLSAPDVESRLTDSIQQAWDAAPGARSKILGRADELIAAGRRAMEGVFPNDVPAPSLA